VYGGRRKKQKTIKKIPEKRHESSETSITTSPRFGEAKHDEGTNAKR